MNEAAISVQMFPEKVVVSNLPSFILKRRYIHIIYVVSSSVYLYNSTCRKSRLAVINYLPISNWGFDTILL